MRQLTAEVIQMKKRAYFQARFFYTLPNPACFTRLIKPKLLTNEPPMPA
jgi:hypothetical protein